MFLLRRKALHLLPKKTLFTMKGLIYCFCAVLILASCRGGKKTEVTIEDNDSLAVAPDSSVMDSLPAPSKSADGLFDDFIYSFMRNPRFQSEREDWVQQMVAQGAGVCSLPEHSAIVDGIVLRAVKGLTLSRNISMVAVSGSANPREVRVILGLSKDFNW